MLRAISERQALRAQVASDKASVAAALQNPEGAALRYLGELYAKVASLKAQGAELPAHLRLLDRTSRVAAVKNFIAGLRDIARRNAEAGPDLSFGINEFTWLTTSQFQELFLSNIIETNTEVPPGAEQPPGRKLQQAIIPTACANTAGRAWDANLQPFRNLLVDNIDWRAPGVASPFNVVPAIRNQGQVRCGAQGLEALRQPGLRAAATAAACLSILS
jgi:hypothetical protein